ncbi:hypothetical protein GUJ93_ZPchr0001g30829 [Zizania palustris]|uniref:Uncharacterized protein n=1 Tax=Zizania palustris TaxID=103762 RepID=A0A8J5RUU8_ZIZPA|nr:hypothetical protein GUJ93_ZPchr0001g30829 [Zizania palustris]
MLRWTKRQDFHFQARRRQEIGYGEVTFCTDYVESCESPLYCFTCSCQLPSTVLPAPIDLLEVIPMPVWHGKGYRSLGFRFGRICYISDVSDIPEETYKLMEGYDEAFMR